MSGHGKSARFVRLAALQELVATGHRRALGIACTETDARRAEEALQVQELAAAEAGLDAVYKSDRLCPIRLALAAAIVEDEEKALRMGRERLGAAEAAEDRVKGEWTAACHRTRWFEDRALVLRRQEISRRDDTAERNALMLRLALGQGDTGPHAGVGKAKS